MDKPLKERFALRPRYGTPLALAARQNASTAGTSTLARRNNRTSTSIGQLLPPASPLRAAAKWLQVHARAIGGLAEIQLGVFVPTRRGRTVSVTARWLDPRYREARGHLEPALCRRFRPIAEVRL
jgi:hypothetical protein